ncbi:MAG: BCCT family transporter [Gammaproteobacteria bacterium]
MAAISKPERGLRTNWTNPCLPAIVITLASVSTWRLEDGYNPARWNIGCWSGAVGSLPIALLFAEGGLKVVQSATIVVSPPLIVVGVLMALSPMRMLREDVGARQADNWSG